MADEKHAEKGPAATGAASGSVNVEAVRQLLVLMTEHELAELEFEQGDTIVRLRKASAAMPMAAMPMAAPVMQAAAVPAVAAAPAAAPAAPKEEKLPAVTSPMVGTYYSASSPDAQPFIKVGDHVTEETVVCIIEAMKVFNEIRAEMRGTVERILVKNAQAVEFGQPLIAVRPE
jgi:acetyl-CoA carboxylase biotin carboxyl carrier protein